MFAISSLVAWLGLYLWGVVPVLFGRRVHNLRVCPMAIPSAAVKRRSSVVLILFIVNFVEYASPLID